MITIDPAVETRQVAALIQKSLVDLGHCYTTQADELIPVRFSSIGYGDIAGVTWAVCEVDCQRLPRRVTARDLTRDETLHHLQTVCGRPVRCLNSVGVTYFVQLTPPPPAPRLPTRVPLALDDRPAGDLMLPLGIGREGALWQSLPSLGHTLIAGTSGSGKSSWLHAALAALLTSASPTALQITLVDPKVSEFAAWARAPHLLAPIATDERAAGAILSDLVSEVDRRGNLLAGRLCRDLAAYNRQASSPLPIILVIFDEVLDLLLATGGERSGIGRLLTRLAAKGRSAGIILWVASQHARFDLLPRAVTVNLSSRIVFRVADSSAANLAGCPGAERIPRAIPGRFLASIGGEPPAAYQAFSLDDAALLAIAQTLTGVDVLAGADLPMPALSDEERALVVYADTHLVGAFTVGKLTDAFPAIKRHRIAEIARAWEAKGWLTTPADAVSPRMLTDTLRSLAGQPNPTGAKS